MNVLLVGLVFAGVAVDRATPRLLQIDLRVVQTDPSAPRSEQREKVLAEPRVVTTTGRPACFRVGGRQLAMRFGKEPLGGAGFVRAPFGIEIETLVRRAPSGELRLEMRVVGQPPEPQLRLDNANNEQTWEAGALVRPGTMSRFRPAIDVGEGTTWVEVTVTEVRPQK